MASTQTPNFNRSKFPPFYPPLFLAAKQGHDAIVELLLAVVDINPNLGVPGGESPLSAACWEGHLSIVKQLLARRQRKISTIQGLQEGAFIYREAVTRSR
jgi:ankyrin repeat protein